MIAAPESEKSGGDPTLKKLRPLIESATAGASPAGVCDSGASELMPLTATASEIGSIACASSRRACWSSQIDRRPLIEDGKIAHGIPTAVL